jgi:hypothetical protein
LSRFTLLRNHHSVVFTDSICCRTKVEKEFILLSKKFFIYLFSLFTLHIYYIIFFIKNQFYFFDRNKLTMKLIAL